VPSIIKKLISALVILAFILGFLIQAEADIVFQDNFQSGNFNKWTVFGSPNIVTSPTVTGSEYSSQFPSYSTSSLGVPSSNISYIQAPFPQSNSATLEFNFQFDPIVQDILFADIINGGIGNMWLMVTPFNNNGSLNFVFTCPTSEKGFSGTSVLSNVQPNVWYKFDIAVNSISGAIQLSINDSLVFSETNVQFSWNPTDLKLGTIITAGNSTGNVYIDNVTVTNTANISQLTSTTTTTISPMAIILTPSPTGSLTPIQAQGQNNIPEFPSSAVILTLFTALLLSIALTVTTRKRKVTIR
jgi:hypothetical protein